jgi:hypothetical protein
MAALWWQLPPANRHRLLWLLRQLVERQLPGESLSAKEDSDESHADTTRG